MQEKVNDFQEKVQNLEVIKEEQEENYDRAKERYDKLTQIGEQYGIKLDAYGNVIASKKQAMLKKKYDDVKKAERALQAELDNIEKHNKMDNKERKKQIRHLTSRKTQTGKQIMEKIADIREKALELSGIIQKMKTYDIGEDIL